MVKERKLAVPYTTILIAQLPEETQRIIRADLMEYAREHNERLEWDLEAQDYAGMTRRFCDIEEIYRDTALIFCEPGEDCNQRAQTDGFAEQNGRDAERADLTCRY